ncbi:sulfatase-like hydrolase/transferase [Micromonospora siamensis]|uniref:Sulfatase n=1 Tax=Micromonospora siamensis TaxID=299152 RepID=A0A1C5J1E7_9ACTN|nr:sulfatase-like hydrolase/transferase [Micromonospora siamensis]SCG64404.1 Sulfatase [Micromonospora siamensis]
MRTDTTSRTPAAAEPADQPDGAAPQTDPGRRSRPAAVVATGLAALLVLAALAAPDRLGGLDASAFVRIPVEALLIAALLLALPWRAGRVVAASAGAALGLLAVLKLLDMGFFEARDRPFDLLQDWTMLDDGLSFLADSIGSVGAWAVAVLTVLLTAGLVVATARSVLRLGRSARRHRAATTRVVAALTVAWTLCALLGVRTAPGGPVADASASALVRDHVAQVRAGLRDRDTFATRIGVDAFADTPGDRLLGGLRGKDVVVSFVESYGRVAVEDPAISPGVTAVLDDGTRRLRAAGFTARSAYLTSPTAGGGSWLAHATLLSGLRVDNERRHTDLLASDRLTLNGAFRRAGWQTVGVLPAATQPWPEARFYTYDRYYDAARLAYRGPKFSYAPMPDQYTLATFQRLERGRPGHAPLMAEIPLVSSHTPWAPLPEPVGWDRAGDAGAYAGMPERGESPDAVWQDPARVRAAYGRSIRYSVGTLVSWLERYGDDDLVLVFLGDHQPAPIVTGPGASRDVPVTVVARDPAVLARIAGWGWQDGLRPGPDAPVWPMDSFRDRFLTAFAH